jgi:hypothetical protein
LGSRILADMASDNSQISLAVFWFTTLALGLIPLYIHPSWGVLGCLLLLTAYGILLFGGGESLSPSYRPNRYFPWLVWVLTLIALVAFRPFTPHDHSSELVNKDRSLPVSVNGIRPGMSTEAVAKLLGPAKETRILASGTEPETNFTDDLQRLMAEVFLLEHSSHGAIRYQNRDELERSLDRNYRLRPQRSAPADMIIHDIESNLRSGFDLVIISTEQELSRSNLNKILEISRDPDKPVCAFLVVGESEACYTLDGTDILWSYDGLTVIFHHNKVELVRGDELFVGSGLWARAGDSSIKSSKRMHKLGQDFRVLDDHIDALGPERPDSLEQWGSVRVGLKAASKTIMFFELTAPLNK